MDDRINDDTLMLIFSLVGYGAGDGELTCPAARIACVSKRWSQLYRKMKRNNLFIQYPLKRLFDWTLQMEENTAATWAGAGDIESVADPASRRALPRWQDDHDRLPLWWTSNDGSFSGRRWRARPADCQSEPYYCTDPDNPPTLEVCFEAPTIVRAIAIEGRNVPRLVRVGADGGGQNNGGDFEIQFRPCQQPVEVPIQTERYMDLVAAYLPQGRAAGPHALQQIPCLPTAFPQPILCQEKLRLHLLQSQEARWVGMNVLAVFGEPVQDY